MTKRFIVVLLTVLVLAQATPLLAQQVWPKSVPAAAGDPDKPFTFAVLGDNRPSQVTAPQPQVYLDIIDRINKSQASFVINTGDVTYGGTDEPGMANVQVNHFISTTKKLKVPCYIAFGNHEAGSEMLPIMTKRLNPLYFAFNYGNSRFYLLNTEISEEQGQITGKQLEWLRKDLATTGSKMTHRFVFFHRPMFSPMNDTGKREWGKTKNLKKLQRLFADNRVDTVFNGHDHYFSWRLVDGVRHIVTGGGGAPTRGYETPGALSIHHYILVEVDGERISMKLVPMEVSQEAPANALLARGSNRWKYTDKFALQELPEKNGKKWYNIGYDVSDWQEAVLPLGYADQTKVKLATTIEPNGGNYYVVKSFAVPAKKKTRYTAIFVSSDDAAQVFINGRLVIDDPAISAEIGHKAKYWNRTEMIDPGVIKTGTNYIAIKLVNEFEASRAFLDIEIVPR